MQYYNRHTASFLETVPNLPPDRLAALGIYQYVSSPELEYDKYTERLWYGEITFGETTCWQSVEVQPLPEDLATLMIDVLRQDLLKELNTNVDTITKQLTASYPDTEVLSFAEQSQQARIYEAAEDKSPEATPIPLLRKIAEQREIPIEALVHKVLIKTMEYSYTTGNIFGQRQAIEKQLEEAATVEELRNISLNITVPTPQPKD